MPFSCYSDFDKGHLTPANLFRWNDKVADSGNLHINVAPQSSSFNRGSWKSLERVVECASKNSIHAIVATGITGRSDYEIGSNIHAPKYFWKMVCYRERKSLKTHVALFIGDNKPGTETKEMKKITLTPRSQEELQQYDVNLLTFHNTWDLRRLTENFAMILRFPTMLECRAAMKLPQDQVDKWKSHFPRVFADVNKSKKRKNRPTKSIEQEAFCTRSQLDALFGLFGGRSFDDDDGDDREGNDIEFEECDSDEECEPGADLETDDDDDDETGDIVEITASNCDKRIVGYYPSWTKVPVSTLLFSKFTHIIFAFFEMKSDGTVGIGNPDHGSEQTLSDAEVEETARANLKTLLKAKANLPDLKMTFAVGKIRSTLVRWQLIQNTNRILLHQFLS